MTDENKVNRAHKNVVGFMNWGKYVIAFDEGIYGDDRDAVELEKILQKVLNPEKHDLFGGWDDMMGGFVKDNIRVDTFWTSLMDYFWTIDTDNEAVQKKVYKWACEVSDECLKLQLNEIPPK